MVGQSVGQQCVCFAQRQAPTQGDLQEAFQQTTSLSQRGLGVLKPACPLSTDLGNQPVSPSREHISHLLTALWRGGVCVLKGLGGEEEGLSPYTVLTCCGGWSWR